MSLNPPILLGGVPAVLIGEWFCLERGGLECRCDTQMPGLRTLKFLGARMYLTTLRICIVGTVANNSGIQSLEIPLTSISGENFAQPIFGCNYWEANIRPSPGGGLLPPSSIPSQKPPRVRIYFLNGGAGTFLRVFFGLIARHRINDAQFFQPPAMESWIREMLQDPNDSSRLFLVQPAPSTAQHAPVASIPGFSQAR